jgi:hypothetical protein
MLTSRQQKPSVSGLLYLLIEGEEISAWFGRCERGIKEEIRRKINLRESKIEKER